MMKVLDYLHINCSLSTIAALDAGVTTKIKHLDDITGHIPDHRSMEALGDMKINTKLLAPLALAVADIGKYLAKQQSRSFSLVEKGNMTLLRSYGEPTFSLMFSDKTVLLGKNSDYVCDDQTYEVACTSTAYAVTHNEKCAAAIKLYAENQNDRTLAAAHKVILDFIDSEELKVGAEKNHVDDFTTDDFMQLSELIPPADPHKFFKSEKLKAQMEFATVTARFSSEDFKNVSGIPVDKKYKLDRKFYSTCNAIKAGEMKSCLLYGPAGTGKSASAKLICREIGLPVVAVINCTANTDEYLLGKYQMKDGVPSFCESDVTKAVRGGGAVIFEEINFAKPQYLAFLNSLLDDNGFIQLDTGERVERHENFRFFATMNDGYAGTNMINEALINRMDIVCNIPEMDDSFIKQTLIKEVPSCEGNVDKMLSVFRKIKTLFEDNAYDGAISIRNLLSWARMAKYEDYVSAAEKTVLGSIINDVELRAACRDILNIYSWD